MAASPAFSEEGWGRLRLARMWWCMCPRHSVVLGSWLPDLLEESCQDDGPERKSSGFCREAPGTAGSPWRFLSHVTSVKEEGRDQWCLFCLPRAWLLELPHPQGHRQELKPPLAPEPTVSAPSSRGVSSLQVPVLIQVPMSESPDDDQALRCTRRITCHCTPVPPGLPGVSALPGLRPDL